MSWRAVGAVGLASVAAFAAAACLTAPAVTQDSTTPGLPPVVVESTIPAPASPAPDAPTVTAPAVEPSSVVIPSIGVQMPVTGEGDLEATDRYDGVLALELPADASAAVWWSHGAPLAGGDEGTTLIAAHVAFDGVPGPFSRLDELAAGDAVWTADANGTVQEWTVTGAQVLRHIDLPQDVFASDGVRRLVLVSCYGEPGPEGRTENILVTATLPVSR